MAVLPENFDSFNYFRKKLFTSQWQLIIPKSWGLNSLQEVINKDFAGYDRKLDYLLPTKLKNLNVTFTANDWRLIEDKVNQQVCWSIVPARYGDKEKVLKLPLNHLLKETQFYVYFKKELAKNKDVQYIVEQLI